MISDYTEQEIEDGRARDRARAMVDRLAEYAGHRDCARAAERKEQTHAARLFRADARAALHTYPELLAMVEPAPVERPYGEGQMWHDAQRSADEPILSLVERVGEWTGR